MQRQQINVCSLSRQDLERVLLRYDALVDTITAANNTLLDKMMKSAGTTNDQVAILNDWSLCLGGLNSVFLLEIAKTGMTGTTAH